MALTRPQQIGIGVGTLALVLLLTRKSRARTITTPSDLPTDQIKAIIKAEAGAQGVNPKLALLFADLESRFNPDAVGDRDWPFRSDNWQRFVRDNPRYAANPFRTDRDLWVSYGLFQLLSPFELWRENPNADPSTLLDVRTNARLGVAKIRRLQERFGVDPLKIRIAYVCGSLKCSRDKMLSIAEKLVARAPLHNLDLGTRSDALARAQALANEFG
jgi:hypothetical protein